MVLLVFVLLFVILYLFLLVGLLHCQTGCFLNKRRRFRLTALTQPGFWKNFVAAKAPEEPFEIIELPSKEPLTDKALVFSLYGTNTEKYFKPLLKNIRNQGWSQHGFHFRIYVHDQCNDWIDILRAETNVQLYIVRDSVAAPGNSGGAFWRFLALLDSRIGCVIHDSDESMSVRKIVHKWEALQKDNRSIHVVQFFPFPKTHIQAQKIYKKKTAPVPCDVSTITNYPHRSTFGSDEIFLTREFADFYISRKAIRYSRNFPLSYTFVCKSRHCN